MIAIIDVSGRARIAPGMSAELPRSRDRLRDCPVDIVVAEVKCLPGRTRVEMEMCGLPKNDIRPIMPGLDSGGAHPAPVRFRSGGGFRGAGCEESRSKTLAGPVNGPPSGRLKGE